MTLRFFTGAKLHANSEAISALPKLEAFSVFTEFKATVAITGQTHFWNHFGNTLSPTLIGGVIIGLGTVAGLAIKSTGVGLLAAAGVGCAAGLASTAVGDGLTGNKSGVGGYAGACAGGAPAGAFGFGFGKLGAAAIK